MASDDDTNGFSDMTNREMLRVILEEIADVRQELKDDIANLDHKLSHQISALDSKLSHQISKLDDKVDNLNLKVDKNHIAFMSNLHAIDVRTSKLEASIA